MLVKCREYATRRRIEHGHKKIKYDMDVDGLDEQDWKMRGEDAWMEEDHWDVDYVYKGKGKGTLTVSAA